MYCLDGIRHIDGASLAWALVWNVGTCRLDIATAGFGWLREGVHQVGNTSRCRVPMRGTGADRLVVAVKPGNAGGAKGTDHPGLLGGQPVFLGGAR